MSQVQGQPTAQVNEFGTVVTPTPGELPINKQGTEPTLQDILDAVRGKSVDSSAPVQGQRQIDTTPQAQAKVGDEASTTPDVDPLAGSGEVIDTGNKALDVAVRSFIKSTGATDADIQRACKNAIEYGDAALIDDAFLQERFKDRAGDARAIVEAVLEQSQQNRTSLISSVYEAAGGEESWKASLAVYKQHAPAGLQKALKLMFDSGDAASVKEAAALVVDFAKGSGVIPKVGTRQQAGASVAEASGLSKAEFQTALGKLNPSSRSYRDDYNKLVELRRVGQQIGR